MSTLAGARIRRVDRPTSELVTLELTAGERIVLLLSVTAGASGAGVVRVRPRGRPIDSFGMLLRRKLEGGSIVGLETESRGARLIADGHDGLVVLEMIHARDGRGFRLVDASGHRLGETARHLVALDGTTPIDDAPLAERGESLARSLVTRMLAARRGSCVATLERAASRLRRAIAAVSADAARATDVHLLRHEADLLMSAAGDDRAGRSRIEVLDWMLDPPAPRAIALDPSRRLKEEAERRYRRARKLERGVTIAAERRAKLERELEPMELLLDRARRAEDDAALTSVEEAVERLGLAPVEPSAKRAEPVQRTPYREFRSLRQIPIWVGKNAVDNDELTVRLARPHHLFLHARGHAGAHVIVALEKGSVCDESALVDAATLAAHFSEARGESSIEVLHAERRHVRKRKGSPAGAVQVDREKVMLLRLEQSRLARLLESEVAVDSKRKRPRGS